MMNPHGMRERLYPVIAEAYSAGVYDRRGVRVWDRGEFKKEGFISRFSKFHARH